MEEYISYRNIYFQVTEFSSGKFIASALNNEFISEVHSSFYKECKSKMESKIDALIEYFDAVGVISKESDLDRVNNFSFILNNIVNGKHFALNKFIRLNKLIMAKQNIYQLVSNDKIFDISYGNSLLIKNCIQEKNNKHLFFCRVAHSIDKKSFNFPTTDGIRHYKLDDYNFTFEFIDKSNDSFCEVFHFEYRDTAGDIKRGSLEIELDSCGLYIYKFFNAEDIFSEKRSGYCVGQNYFDWADKYFPSVFRFTSEVNKDDAFQFRQRYFFSLFIEAIMEKKCDAEWLISFANSDSELRQTLNLWAVTTEDVNNFYNDKSQKYDKKEIQKILNGYVETEDIDSNIIKLAEFLKDGNSQKIFNRSEILEIEKYCWKLVNLRDEELLATIILLKLEGEKTDKEIFDYLFPNDKEYKTGRKQLGLRGETLNDVENKSQKINQQLKKIPQYCREKGLPEPNIKKQSRPALRKSR